MVIRRPACLAVFLPQTDHFLCIHSQDPEWPVTIDQWTDDLQEPATVWFFLFFFFCALTFPARGVDSISDHTNKSMG